MKIKDLPNNTNLLNIKIRVPDNISCTIHEGYWQSQWPKGVWLAKTKSDLVQPAQDKQIYPVCIEDLMEVLEWEVLEY